MNDLILLAALLPGPSYGYALKRQVGLILGTGEMHNNLVYPLLRGFLRRGWVAQSTAPGERGQQRKRYRLTAAGRAEVLRRLAQFDEKAAAQPSAFLFRVALFDILDAPARRKILDLRAAHLARTLERLSTVERESKPVGYARRVLDFKLTLLRNELRWARNLQKDLKGRR
ncbi:MAG: helix-turn-helix transcriptional regulator [Candidatus Acidiferrales bacterium]